MVKDNGSKGLIPLETSSIKPFIRESTEYIELAAPSDFHFSEILAYMGRSGQEILYRIKNQHLFRLIKINDRPILMKIGFSHHNIRIEFLNYRPRESERLKCAEEVWECFDLGRNLDGFYRMAEKDKVLKPLVLRYRGFRIVGITDLFEAMTWAVIGQQINLPFAYTLKRRLIEAYGQHITYNDENYWLYPTPERMAEATVQELTALQFTGRKAEYIIDIAKMITKGELLKDHLNHEDAETTLKRLISIRGIGQWTAQYVMLRCLKIPTAIPMTDVGLQNAIKAQLKMKRKPTIDEIERLADGWDGWQAYATFYLWRSLLG